MDIRLYFNAIDFSKFLADSRQKDKNSLGSLIQKNTLAYETLKKIDIAIFGVKNEDRTPNKGTAKAPDEIRKALYSLKAADSKLKIVDLGNLKKGNSQKDTNFALRDITDYLRDAGITTIVLGGGQDLSVGIARSFENNEFFQLTSVDSQIDLKTTQKPFDSENYISKILLENPRVFNINFLGYQSYFVSPKTLAQAGSMQFEAFRLGQIRENIENIEPILRDTDFLSFDIGAIKQSEAPGYYDGSPNGLTGEEACQIARYAGLSDKLRVFGIFEINPLSDINGMTVKLSAQIIWYFLEGYSDRKNEDPLYGVGYTCYHVEAEGWDMPLVFFHNPLTERWWMEISSGKNSKFALACTEGDYLAATSKDLPARWLKFIRKIDQMSK